MAISRDGGVRTRSQLAAHESGKGRRAMIVDTAFRELEAKGRPVRVGMVGAGATGRAIALQLGTPVPGIRLVAIANRTLAQGERAYRESNVKEWRCVHSVREAEASILQQMPVLTDDPSVLTACEGIDIIVEVTGSVEPAADVVL